MFDVTSFIADQVANGTAFVGFNLREEPANTPNFLVMFLQGAPWLPTLAIEYSTEQIIDIDIKPGSVPNSINRHSAGKIPVALLSSPSFDVFNAVDGVDTTSLSFGRTGDELSLSFCGGRNDVNGDGLLDLVCHFDTPATGFLSGDSQGVVKGSTLSGMKLKGLDSVRVLQ